MHRIRRYKETRDKPRKKTLTQITLKNLNKKANKI